MTAEFFKQLSMYYDKENDLSNITCVMCNSSVFFKEKFIHFFFPELDVNSITSIQREVCDDDDMHSRVDMFITVAGDDKPYLIEVKIYDENHHFGQYEVAYKVPKERLGYITNYVCTEGIEKGYDVKTWNEWYNVLTDSLPLIKDEEEKHLAQGYLVYLREVCGICNIVTSLEFDDHSEKSFMDSLRQVINHDSHLNKPHVTRQYASQKEYNVLTFQYDEGRRWAFAGIIYNNGTPVISVGFCENIAASLPAYKTLVSCNPKQDEWFGSFIKRKFLSTSSAIIPMSEEKHNELTACKTMQEQSTLICAFINRVVDYVTSKS